MRKVVPSSGSPSSLNHFEGANEKYASEIGANEDEDHLINPLVHRIEVGVSHLVLDESRVSGEHVCTDDVTMRRSDDEGGKDKRSTKVVATEAILEAASKLAGKGDEEVFVRLLRPATGPMEINTRENLATVIFGQKYGEIVVDKLIYRNPVFAVSMLILWIIGSVIGTLSLFNVLPPIYAIIGGIFLLPTITNGYLLLIIHISKILVRRFETW
jgi:hypothetical protein